MNRLHSIERPAGLTRPRQSGVALIVALIMLLLITLIGLAAARSQTMEMRMTVNTQNRELAVQSAEAALRFAEDGIASGIYTDFSGGTAGLYQFNALATTPPAYMCISGWLNYAGANCAGTAYATVSPGPPPLPIAGVTTPQAASVLIEELPPVAASGNSIGFNEPNKQPPQVVIRITAQGYGADGTSSVRLQSIYQ
jgi:type IV pilus assembly protein PilX